MSTIFEEEIDAPAGVGRVIVLLAVPAIALAVMAALVMHQESPRRQPASQTTAGEPGSTTASPPSARYDAHYTLYIMSSADEAKRLPALGARAGLDWFAYVSTPEEEAELIRARDEADWFRYAAGLPRTRVVDLRVTPAVPASAHAAVP